MGGATHAQPPEALTLGFQRGLLGASIALVIAAVIALRSPNVRVVDMAHGRWRLWGRTAEPDSGTGDGRLAIIRR